MQREPSELDPAPFAYWIALHPVEELTASEEAELRDFYDNVHVPEVVERNQGFVRGRRWELTDPGNTGYDAPRWLAAYDIADRASAQKYAANAAAGIGVTPPYSTFPDCWKKLQVRWRLIWETVYATGDDVDPERMFLVGMSPKPGCTEAEHADFNEFYSTVHVPEVMAKLGFDNGIRTRVHTEIEHAGGPAPLYCAAYQSPDAAAGAAVGQSSAQWSEGPVAWQERVVSWRLGYQRLRPVNN